MSTLASRPYSEGLYAESTDAELVTQGTWSLEVLNDIGLNVLVIAKVSAIPSGVPEPRAD